MIIDKEGNATETETTVTIETADPPIEAVTIDVGAEDGKEVVTETKADDQDKPKKQGRFQAKINQLTARAAHAETTAERILRENEELKGKLRDVTQARDVADRAALVNYDNNVKLNLTQAKKALVEATNSGDANAIAEATAEVSRWGSEAANLDRWKQNHPEPKVDDGDDASDDDGQDQRRQQQQQRPQAQQQEFSPDLKAWLAENSWFNPRTPDGQPNPDFDIEMHNAARAHGQVLEQRYIRQGKKVDQAYWNELTRLVREEFPDDDAEPAPTPRRATPKMNGDASVAPARSSQAPAAGSGQLNGTKITLTPEQRQMAWSMADNGAYLDPKTKQPLSHHEAEVRFAKAIAKDIINQAANGRTR